MLCNCFSKMSRHFVNFDCANNLIYSYKIVKFPQTAQIAHSQIGQKDGYSPRRLNSDYLLNDNFSVKTHKPFVIFSLIL